MKTMMLGAMMFAALPVWALPVHGVGCAATAEAAVAHLIEDTDAGRAAGGYRVEGVRLDSFQRRGWAMVASCEAPSRPLIAVALPAEALASVAQRGENVVHVGDRVQVLAGGTDSHMLLTGWAEQAGTEQQSIHVRLDSSVISGEINTEVRCRVLRAGVVEVTR